MNTWPQWIHQHDFLLIVVALLLCGLLLLSRRRAWTKQSLLMWSSAPLFLIVLFFGLRTPAASVHEAAPEPVLANTLNTQNAMMSDVPSVSELDFTSVDEIEAYLQSGDKPTLVEFYSDFGIS